MGMPFRNFWLLERGGVQKRSSSGLFVQKGAANRDLKGRKRNFSECRSIREKGGFENGEISSRRTMTHMEMSSVSNDADCVGTIIALIFRWVRPLLPLPRDSDGWDDKCDIQNRLFCLNGSDFI
ncbi:hypothetical protein NPIL_12291 [Nephila pilipes]|uniref:Uncharacterized protein n=1 Tax=Nephila pilipes TaxID=299642 RepID=A0A8X6PDS8_NEPPI|nr:hypothetical protein NPIL_12291 [Nephila pilipes]